MTAPLTGWTLDLPSERTTAGAHAVELAALLGASPAATRRPGPDLACRGLADRDQTAHDLAAWASSGAMALTGYPDGPPLAPAVPLVPRLDGVLAVFRAVAAARGRPVDEAAAADLTAGVLLSERAAAAGLRRGGRHSAGAAARLVRAADSWLVVNLPRPEDAELVAAWLEAEVDPADPWPATEALLATRPGRAATDRAALLGLPVAEVTEPEQAARDEQAAARGQHCPFAPFLLDGAAAPRPPGQARPTGPSQAAGPPRTLDRPHSVRRRTGPFVVVDLSSLWAGPLCSHLLGLAGAEVVK
nr:CoA transferase [Micromonospora sp. DSM 115978]